MQQRRVLTKVRRGDFFYGEVIDPGNNQPFIIEVTHGKDVIASEIISTDQEECEIKLSDLMDRKYREINKRPAPGLRKVF